eukprot:ctg_5136.g663
MSEAALCTQAACPATSCTSWRMFSGNALRNAWLSRICPRCCWMTSRRMSDGSSTSTVGSMPVVRDNIVGSTGSVEVVAGAGDSDSDGGGVGVAAISTGNVAGAGSAGVDGDGCVDSTSVMVASAPELVSGGCDEALG